MELLYRSWRRSFIFYFTNFELVEADFEIKDLEGPPRRKEQEHMCFLGPPGLGECAE